MPPVMANNDRPDPKVHQLLAGRCMRVEAITRGRAWLVADRPWPADEVAAELVEVSADALTE